MTVDDDGTASHSDNEISQDGIHDASTMTPPSLTNEEEEEAAIMESSSSSSSRASSDPVASSPPQSSSPGRDAQQQQQQIQKPTHQRQPTGTHITSMTMRAVNTPSRRRCTRMRIATNNIRRRQYWIY
mmetsp:Transcript_25789/g.55478  ORF Transcript_25789/g.55478 Transcript_25789/m.55478 type:complete len:128 (+) Transcript_25789:27-410(+)